jgi:hypothetical protein
MIKAGLICNGCGRSCKNQPTEFEPLVVACPTCDEQGCGDCNGEGFFYVRGCPKQEIDLELYHVIKLADYLESGLPPVAGGSLNQAAWFMDFSRLLRSEVSLAEGELYKGGSV